MRINCYKNPGDWYQKNFDSIYNALRSEVASTAAGSSGCAQVEKKFSRNMATENDVMISYQRDSKEGICKLEEELKKRGLTVWRDDTRLRPNGQLLTEQLGRCFI